MRAIRLLSIGITAGVAASIYGCGSGGGTGGGGASLDALVQGRASLSQLASGQKTTSTQTLQDALTLFLQALQKSPNSSEAHFGAAVCLAGQIAQEADNVPGSTVPAPPAAPGKPGSGGGSGGSTPQPPSPPMALGSRQAAVISTDQTGEVPPTPPSSGQPIPEPLPARRTLGLFWNLDNSIASPYVLLHMLAPISDLGLGLIPYYGYPADDAAHRQKLLDGLNTVVDHLTKVEADPNFSITLPDMDSNDKQVVVGLPEVYLFDAYIQSLRAEVALSLAYIRDPGPTWSASIFTSVGSSGGAGGVAVAARMTLPPLMALDRNADGKLTPNEYLPASPYLTLRDPKLLQTAQASILAVADRERKGIDGVLARPASGSFLVPNVAEVQTALTNIRDSVLPIIQQAATGPFTIDVPRWAVAPQPLPGDGTVVPQSTASTIGEKVFAAANSVGTVTGGVTSSIARMAPIKVNLAAWFTNPPADLKAFAPTLFLDSGGVLQPEKTTYPDKTFGGLFPDGIADGLPF